MKGLTREQATTLARTMRLNKKQVYKLWVKEGKLAFNKIEEIGDYSKNIVLFTGSWDRLLEIQHRLTQALLTDILYKMVNGSIKTHIEKGNLKQPKETTTPKKEYITKEEVLQFVETYLGMATEEGRQNTRIREHYIYYNRQRDKVYLATDIDKNRGGYLEGIVVYDLEPAYEKIKSTVSTNKIKAQKIAEHAYKVTNRDIHDYWKDLHENYEDEL